MRLAKVVGQVVSTVKNPSFDSLRILLVRDLQQLEPDDDTGEAMPYAVADPIGAGEGELVVVVQGSAGLAALEPLKVPTDAAIVAIIDSVTHHRRVVYSKE